MAATNKLREKLTEQFIASLSEGQLPWNVCWQNHRPINALSGNSYKGVNSYCLSFVAAAFGYKDYRWCTFNQAKSKGWSVKKGEKGTYVEYWCYFDKEKQKILSWPDANKIMKTDPEYAEKNFFLTTRCHVVFNADQIEGIPQLERRPEADIGAIRENRDTLLKNMNLRYEEGGNQAYYVPDLDMVVLPPEHSFFDSYGYMSTFLHECGHATGHETRLNRDQTGDFGSENYAREELRAEIASAFTAQAIGLQMSDEQLQSNMEQHKAYIQHWISVLKEKPEELFKAIKDAEGISDYLIEKGEFQRIDEIQIEKSETISQPDPEYPNPVGRIEYLDMKTEAVVEAITYDTPDSFVRNAIGDLNIADGLAKNNLRIHIVFYENEAGVSFPQDFLKNYDPKPSVTIEPLPMTQKQEISPKQKLEDMLAGDGQKIAKQPWMGNRTQEKKPHRRTR